MATHPSIIRVPEAYLWHIAEQAAASKNFQFSMRCEEYFKEQVRVGLHVNRVGTYEFGERRDEARQNVEKLVFAIIAEEVARDPTSRLLHDPSMYNALYKRKLCPGLWPFC